MEVIRKAGLVVHEGQKMHNDTEVVSAHQQMH